MDNGQADETLDSNSTAMSVTEMNTQRNTFVYGGAPTIHNSRLEAAALQLVTRLTAELAPENNLAALIGLGVKTDLLDLCQRVEDEIALAQSAVLPVPTLLEVTGNIDERELAARYMEQKVSGILFHAGRSAAWREQFEHMAQVFRACAVDFRAGLHLPSAHYEGRVIPYNETNDTGIRHEDALRRFFQDVNARNLKAGWWTNIDSGEPLKRSVGEMFILIVTELVEAYKAWLFSEADDKLPQYPGVGVEIGDLLIRVADFCGGLYAGLIVEPSDTDNPGDQMFKEIVEIAERYEAIRKTPAAKGQPETGDFLPSMDVSIMVDAKLDFNAQRPDHKIENRLKEGGKRT